MASHELQTPLSSLKAYTQMLALNGHAMGDDISHMCANMDDQINKLTVLINDLLDTSKLGEGILSYRKLEMSLSETVEEVTAEMRHTNSTIR